MLLSQLLVRMASYIHICLPAAQANPGLHSRYIFVLFSFYFLEAHCLEAISISLLFTLFSVSGMLIKNVDLNNSFPSANSQKVSWCILCPEGKWKLCVMCGNYFLCCCSFFSIWMYHDGDCLSSGVEEGTVWRKVENFQFLFPLSFLSNRYSDFTWSKALYIVKLIWLPQILS